MLNVCLMKKFQKLLKNKGKKQMIIILEICFLHNGKEVFPHLTVSEAYLLGGADIFVFNYRSIKELN